MPETSGKADRSTHRKRDNPSNASKAHGQSLSDDSKAHYGSRIEQGQTREVTPVPTRPFGAKLVSGPATR